MSQFRGSDDVTTFPVNIPENAFAVTLLRSIEPVLQQIGEPALAEQAVKLADEIDMGIQTYGKITSPKLSLPGLAGGGETMYAYEVDGFGNAYFMDDANLPSLLALPYFGYMNNTDPTCGRAISRIACDHTTHFCLIFGSELPLL